MKTFFYMGTNKPILVLSENRKNDELYELFMGYPKYKIISNDKDEIKTQPLDMAWPQGIHSLSHVALPFPASDPLYGENSSSENPGVHLGNVALRGERGVLTIPASAMLRLRWNPFYPYLEQRIFDFVRLEKPERLGN